LQLTTRRLRLTPVTLALLDGDDRPPDWPGFDALPVLRALCEAGEGSPWVPWVVRDGDGAIVGDAGFKGPPDDEGAVEMGWFIRVAHRRLGLSSEAVAALAQWAVDAGARLVRAEIHRDNAASLGVARRAGFTLAGIADDGLHLWLERR
jgi:RimJ/RimL family protein N-acetyltransferase